MRFLLDTSALLWSSTDPDRLGRRREMVEDLANQRLVSAASVWEIAIKYAIGRLRLPAPPARFLPGQMRALVATALPIEQVHALGVAELPFVHDDPFDRLLIAQAQALRVPILTADPVFAQYDVEVLAIS